MRTEYKLELIYPETIKLNGATNKDVDQDKDLLNLF